MFVQEKQYDIFSDDYAVLQAPFAKVLYLFLFFIFWL